MFWTDVALTELLVVVWVLLVTWLLVFVLLFWVVSVVSAFTLLELTAVPAPKESNAIPEAM